MRMWWIYVYFKNFRKKKRRKIKTFSRKSNSIIKEKLTNTQLNKLKSATNNKTGTILRLNKKKTENEELSRKLFLIKRETKIRNVFANNISTDIRRHKAQISKTTQSDRSYSSWLGNLGKKSLTSIAITLARDNFSGLVSNLTSSNAIKKFDRNVSGKGAVRTEKGFTLFISNADMNDIIKIIKSLEDCLDKNFNVFQMTCFNHTLIFLKLID